MWWAPHVNHTRDSKFSTLFPTMISSFDLFTIYIKVNAAALIVVFTRKKIRLKKKKVWKSWARRWPFHIAFSFFLVDPCILVKLKEKKQMKNGFNCKTCMRYNHVWTKVHAADKAAALTLKKQIFWRRRRKQQPEHAFFFPGFSVLREEGDGRMWNGKVVITSKC